MIVGYLVLGTFGAVLASAWAVLTGFGLLAILGFYMLGGTLGIVLLLGAALTCRPLYNASLRAAKI